MSDEITAALQAAAARGQQEPDPRAAVAAGILEGILACKGLGADHAGRDYVVLPVEVDDGDAPAELWIDVRVAQSLRAACGLVSITAR